MDKTRSEKYKRDLKIYDLTKRDMTKCDKDGGVKSVPPNNKQTKHTSPRKFFWAAVAGGSLQKRAERARM